MDPATICRRIVRNDPTLTNVDIVDFSAGNLASLMRALSLESTNVRIHNLALARSEIQLKTFVALMALVCNPQPETSMGHTMYVSPLKKLTFCYHDGQDLADSIACRLFGGIALNFPPGMADLNHVRVCIAALNKKSAVAIKKALETTMVLMELDLSKNRIMDVPFSLICAGLTINTSLIDLNLDETGIGDGGAQQLAVVLGQNSFLTFLSLGSNQIGNVGAIALANALEHHNSTLKVLTLSSNQIGDDGFAAWSQTLCVNLKLMRLCIEGNPRLTLAGEQAFADSIAGMIGLKDLTFGPLQQTSTLIRVAAAMEHNHMLQEITCEQHGLASAVQVVPSQRQQRGAPPAAKETPQVRAFNVAKYIPLINFRCFWNKVGAFTLSQPELGPVPALWSHILYRFNTESGENGEFGLGGGFDDDDDDDGDMSKIAREMGIDMEMFEAFKDSQDRHKVDQLGGLMSIRGSLIYYALREHSLRCRGNPFVGNFFVAREPSPSS